MDRYIYDSLLIEENFDILLSNYIEYEREVYALLMEWLLRGDGQNSSNFFSDRQKINIKLANFLTAARTYLDVLESVSSHKPHLNLKSNTLSREFDACLEYRFVLKLRNHIQHCGTAIHEMCMGGEPLLENGNYIANFYIEFFVVKSKLNKEKFSLKILNDCPEKIPLNQYLRKFLACLMRVQADVRNIVGYGNFSSNAEKFINNEVNFDQRKLDALRILLAKNVPNDAIDNVSSIGVM